MPVAEEAALTAEVLEITLFGSMMSVLPAFIDYSLMLRS